MYLVKIICYDGLNQECYLRKHKIGSIIEMSNDRILVFKNNIKLIEKFCMNKKAIKCKKCNQIHEIDVKYVIEKY